MVVGIAIHSTVAKFKLNIDIKLINDSNMQLAAHLCLLPGDYDKHLQWPVNVIAHLMMLNQRGDHNHHHECIKVLEYKSNKY